MAFNFNWSPLAADASFYQRARDLLTKALNKSPKPPIIVDDILVDEFNLGSVPPDLEILEVGDIASDRFRGIFKMCYTGDAFLTLKTRVQANPLNTYLSSKPSFTSPEPLAAASSLTIPLQITLSEIKLSAFIIVVFSKQKGLTLVFRNDPLESLKVSSTFDSIQFVRDYLQRTIEGKLRDLMMDELPAIIHRLSLQLWCPDQVPKENDAGSAEDDGEVRVNPLADAPPDAVDANGNPIDDGDISSLSGTGGPETQSLFSQKNLVRLAALTNSHRTLSLFTPGIREVVFRAWAHSGDMQEGGGGGGNGGGASAGGTGTGSKGSPPFSTPNMARSNSYTAAATSTTATTTTYTFSDVCSQDHGHQPLRPTLANLGAASTTGLSLGASHHRHKSYAGRKKKTRVVNLRKSAASNVAGGSAPVSEAGDTASDSVSVQGPLSEPLLPASIPEEDEGGQVATSTEAAASVSHEHEGEENLEHGETAENNTEGLKGQNHMRQKAALVEPMQSIAAALAASERGQQQQAKTSTGGPVYRGVLESVPWPGHEARGEESPRKGKDKKDSQKDSQKESIQKESIQKESIQKKDTKQTPRARTTTTTSSTGRPGYPESSSIILEQAWIMKMASEIARRVYDENQKNPAFWDDGDDAPPPAYEATR